jgi:hemerythrin-like domain-containing protein
LSNTQPIDVRDMAIIHQTFRNAYEESARLVRAAPTPSAARVTFLADHIDFGLAMLHVHHDGEDELVYPKLIERVPERRAVIEQTEHQHREIATALDAASTACTAWRQGANAGTGEALASALDHLNSVVQPHLDDEEQKVVPIAAVTLTQKEWDAVGEHAVAQIPREKKAVAFGMILDPLGPADRAHMKRVLPAPVRVLYPILIDRPWKKYAATLRSGT